MAELVTRMINLTAMEYSCGSKSMTSMTLSPEPKIWRQRLLYRAIAIRRLVMADQIIGNAGYVIPMAIRLFLQVRMELQMAIGSPSISK